MNYCNKLLNPISERDFSYEYFYFFKNIPRLDNKEKEQTNIELIGIEKNHHLNPFHKENFSKNKNVKFIYEDFFKTKMDEFSAKEIFIICNLPYGKRIKVEKDHS